MVAKTRKRWTPHVGDVFRFVVKLFGPETPESEQDGGGSHGVARGGIHGGVKTGCFAQARSLRVAHPPCPRAAGGLA